ncbi:MAG: endolytic transglycosylase MltG [Anaerolineales bacterium]
MNDFVIFRRRILLWLVAFDLLCMLGSLIVGLYVPVHVQEIYGPAAPGLSWQERFTSAALLYTRQDALFTPFDPQGADQVFEVLPGESATGVIGRLWEAGLIEDSAVFQAYLRYRGLDTSIQAGTYNLSPAMSAIEIAQALQDATPRQINFSLLAGWRLEEVFGALALSGLQVDADALLRQARSPDFPYPLKGSLPPGASLEGFLFPGEYTLSRDETSPVAILMAFLQHFDEQVTPEIRRGLENQGLSLYQGVTLAAIVQREAVVGEEMPLIASVFLNRLHQGMRLESDPTVQYALGYDTARGGWWPVPLSLTDLQINSPFNTYQNAGLPPAPIASPSLDAIRAVAFPAQTPYLYFRAACDGSGRHTFAETYEEHLNNGCK